MTILTRGLAAATLAAALLALPAAASAQTVDLRPKLTKGTDARFVMKQDGTMAMTLPKTPGIAPQQTVSQQVRFRLKIDEADEAGARGRITFERIKVSIAGGGMEAAFDSDDPPQTDQNNMLAPSLRPIVGKSLSVTFDGEGNVKQVAGVDDLIPSGQARDLLEGLLGVEALKDNLGRITSTGAGSGPRKVGQTWTDRDTLTLPEGGGKVEMVTRQTLESVDGGDAKVNLEGSIRRAAGSKDSAGPAPKVSFSGRYVWDTNAGMLKSLKVDRTVDFDLNRHGVEAQIHQQVKTSITRQD